MTVNPQTARFINNVNAMNLEQLAKQYDSIVDDSPHHAENGTLEEARRLVTLVETIAELKFGPHEWQRAINPDKRAA